MQQIKYLSLLASGACACQLREGARWHSAGGGDGRETAVEQITHFLFKVGEKQVQRAFHNSGKTELNESELHLGFISKNRLYIGQLYVVTLDSVVLLKVCYCFAFLECNSLFVTDSVQLHSSRPSLFINILDILVLLLIENANLMHSFSLSSSKCCLTYVGPCLPILFFRNTFPMQIPQMVFIPFHSFPFNIIHHGFIEYLH